MKKYFSACQEKISFCLLGKIYLFFSVKEKFSLPLEKNSNLILSGKTICLLFRKKNLSLIQKKQPLSQLEKMFYKSFTIILYNHIT